MLKSKLNYFCCIFCFHLIKQNTHRISEEFHETGNYTFCFLFGSTNSPTVTSSFYFTNVNIYRCYSEPKVELFHFENVASEQSDCSGRWFFMQGCKEKCFGFKKIPFFLVEKICQTQHDFLLKSIIPELFLLCKFVISNKYPHICICICLCVCMCIHNCSVPLAISTQYMYRTASNCK